MLYVGRFTGQELKEGKDRREVERLQRITGLKYVHTREVIKNHKAVAIDIYLKAQF